MACEKLKTPLPELSADEVLKLLTFEREIKSLEIKELEMLFHMYKRKEASGSPLTVLEGIWIDRLEEAIEDCVSRAKLVQAFLS